jgi:hypothetical protein
MPSKTQSILVGGLVVGLLNTSVLQVTAVLCCAGVIIGAMTGVWHYTTTYDLTISAGQGVLIGVAAAALGAVIAGILNYVLALAGLDVLTQLMMGFVENANLPPDQVEMIREQTTTSRGPSAVLLGIATNAVVFVIFGAIGGAIGASVFKRGGDTPGGGGPGGPRQPTGDRPQPSGGPRTPERTPQQPTTGPDADERGSSYRPPEEERAPKT